MRHFPIQCPQKLFTDDLGADLSLGLVGNDIVREEPLALTKELLTLRNKNINALAAGAFLLHPATSLVRLQAPNGEVGEYPLTFTKHFLPARHGSKPYIIFILIRST